MSTSSTIIELFPPETVALPGAPPDKEAVIARALPYQLSSGVMVKGPIITQSNINFTIDVLQQLGNIDPFLGDTSVDISSRATLIKPYNPKQIMASIIPEIDMERLDIKNSSNPYNENELKTFARQLGLNVSTSAQALARDIYRAIEIYHNTESIDTTGIITQQPPGQPRMPENDQLSTLYKPQLCTTIPQGSNSTR